MLDMNSPKPRARELGIPFEGTPGPFNAITDVADVTVGHVTLVSGEGKLIVGQGPVRTGLTAIMPRGNAGCNPVFAGYFSLNGNGEMTGMHWVEESGLLEGPVMLTNTHSVGIVRDAVIEWQTSEAETNQPWSLPVVAETFDGHLNDINGFHIRKKHVFEAIENSCAGPVVEGNTGGGTGMICHEFKGGIGTASRRLDDKTGGFTVGVLVQANHGLRHQLRIAGVPAGLEIRENLVKSRDEGSIIIVVATNAPLLPHQLKRLARRACLGLGRTGSIGSNFSGDIFLAFSTANATAMIAEGIARLTMVPNEQLDPIFDATVFSVEEAIINALVAAESMIGRDDHKVIAIPQDRLCEVMKKYVRLRKDE
jgi:L-aminopeptidase/D-esterase-like protein